METVIEYDNYEKAYITTTERRSITRIEKLKERYPDQVRIIAGPKDNGGCLYASFPVNWVKVSPPRKINMTEERKAKLSERMRNLRNNGLSP